MAARPATLAGMPRRSDAEIPPRTYRFTFNQPEHAAKLLASAGEASSWHTVEGGNMPWPILVRLGLANGRLTVTGIVIGALGEVGEVTSRALRTIRIADLTTLLARDARRGDFFSSMFLEAADELGSGAKLAGRPGRPGYDREHFQGIAAEYRAALRINPHHPIDEIAEGHDVSEATARRWVARARDMGFLERAPIGRAGEQERSES